MYRKIFFLFVYLFFQQVYSQHYLRVSADNDAFIISNNASDWGYTSGNRVDLFYTTSNQQNFFGWFNKLAGTERITTKGWGLMQKIFAPQKTSLSIPDKNDYPYSGALFAIHTIHAANPSKKINLQSEWVVGLMGPPAFGKQTHRFFHRLIKDPEPMGWNYQLPTDLLLNYNVQAEKSLRISRRFNLIGSGKIHAGTMEDAVSAGLQFQMGNYFSGLINQYFAKDKSRVGFSMQASVELLGYKALVQGGLFNSRSPVHDKNSQLGTEMDLHHTRFSGELFTIVSLKKFALSLRQIFTTAELKGFDQHSFGNLSLYLKFD